MYTRLCRHIDTHMLLYTPYRSPCSLTSTGERSLMDAACVEVGDEVTIDMSHAKSSQRHPAWRHGFKTTVIGFPEVAHGRFGELSRKPGVYRNRTLPIINSPDGQPIGIPSELLTFEDDLEYERRERNHEERLLTDTWDAVDFIRDLPDTGFWEGDIVRVHNTSSMPNPKMDGYTVVYITYHNLTSEGGKPFYSVSDSLQTRLIWFRGVPENGMELIERGNVWKLHHNEPLMFTNNREEINFYLGACGRLKVMNGFDIWTPKELISGLRSGLIHAVIQRSLEEHHTAPLYSAWRFRDTEVGKRVAKLFIELLETA